MGKILIGNIYKSLFLNDVKLFAGNCIMIALLCLTPVT